MLINSIELAKKRNLKKGDLVYVSDVKKICIFQEPSRYNDYTVKEIDSEQIWHTADSLIIVMKDNKLLRTMYGA